MQRRGMRSRGSRGHGADCAASRVDRTGTVTTVQASAGPGASGRPAVNHAGQQRPVKEEYEAGLRPKVLQCSKTQGGAEAFAAFTSVLRTTVQRGGCGIGRLTELHRSLPTADR